MSNSEAEIRLSVRKGVDETAAVEQAVSRATTAAGQDLDQLTAKAEAAADAVARATSPGAGGMSEAEHVAIQARIMELDDADAAKNAALKSSFAAPVTPAAPAGNTFQSQAADAHAVNAGMRAAGEGTGFFNQATLRTVQTLGVARVALLGVIGLVGGLLITALAGVVGWLAKATAATPQFQAGLEKLQGSTKGLSDELLRTAAPLTNFLGSVTGDALGGFAGLLDGARLALRGFNDESGTAATRARAACDDIANLGTAADNLAGRLGKASGEIRETNDALAENARRANDAATAQAALTNAQAAVDVSEVNKTEAAG